MIGPQVQQHCDPGMAQRSRELLRQQAALPPHDFQRMAQQDPVAVLIGFRIGHIHPDHCGGVSAAPKVKSILPVGLPGAQKGGATLRRSQQGVQQQLLLVFSAPFQLEFQRGFLPHLLLEAQQNAGELLLLEGLEQIVLHAVFQRVLGIFKFPVSADDDEMQLGLEGLGPLDQFDAVAAGHPDVRDQQMRLLFPHQLQCPQSIVGGACDLVAKRLPVDQLLHQQDHLVFVIGQNDPQHPQHLPRRF